ncbi:MAG: hypothetical protein NT135_01215 [Candidatus Berkelbacteria bacterium]|nr:hypothetical protein [Candidatus Berkelbacteria bacterium]
MPEKFESGESLQRRKIESAQDLTEDELRAFKSYLEETGAQKYDHYRRWLFDSLGVEMQVSGDDPEIVTTKRSQIIDDIEARIRSEIGEIHIKEKHR